MAALLTLPSIRLQARLWLTSTLSIYIKTEISFLYSSLTTQPSLTSSDAYSRKQPVFLAAADETKRALEDYVRTTKEEEELRAMREIRGVFGSVTRDFHEKSSTAKENWAIAADAKILIADEDEAMDAGRLQYASTTTTARETPQHKPLWPCAILLVYVLLTLVVRGLFWIFYFLMAEAERDRNPSRKVEVVHPCDMNWDSEFCLGW